MRNIFTYNLGLKILSLCLAVLLWFFISVRGVSEYSFEVPIRYVNIPKGLEILKKDIEKVEITVIGNERILKTIKPEDLGIVLNLKDAVVGSKPYLINKTDLKLPPAINVSSITPSTVNIFMDRTVQKEVIVKPKIIGYSKSDTDIQVNISPEKVLIEGPESIVKKITSVKTEVIDLSNISGNIIKKVNVISDVNNIRLINDQVEIVIILKGEKR